MTNTVNNRTHGLHWLLWPLKVLGWLLGTALALALCAVMAALMALAVIYPNLPDVSELAHYTPKLPLRVYTSEGTLIREFGEERRNMVPIGEIPDVMKNAVLAVEDARFYEHGGVDFVGVARAALANLGRSKSQGASTITMQVARNVYLSSEKTFARKIYEVLLTLKLEQLLTKDQILEIYMNQIFLGHRAYGFAAAAETYFGKPLKDVTCAEAAMLAGIPKFPSSANPITNYERARQRQLYIIDRMLDNGFISAREAELARNETLTIRPPRDSDDAHAEYAAEMVRQMLFAQYGQSTYSRGLNVYTTIKSDEQLAAYNALRRGILGYERKHAWRGPEKFIELPSDSEELPAAVDDAIAGLPEVGGMPAAVVLEASASRVAAMLEGGQRISIRGAGLRAAAAGLAARAQPKARIRAGAVIRVAGDGREDNWAITQLPEVEGALVAIDPRNGAIRALVGGFHYGKSKFNHATQAWRQPGSTFKPIIYSAALEKGFSPSTMINDTPMIVRSRETGGRPWEPKNYEGGFQGPMTMRRALAKSRNIISVRVLQKITPQFGQQWATRFGFDADKHLPVLPMALGSGSVTPLQMAAAFAVFANGGQRVNPFIISRITDHTGAVLLESQPQPPGQGVRAIDARNAFITGTMLQDVVRAGTAAQAKSLGRSDIYGKTGTTNDAHDAWFVGYQPSLAAAVWMGYDTPRNLGSRETGGGLSLPIWIDFMRSALKGVPVAESKAPEGVSRINGDWAYSEYAHGKGIFHLDGAGLAPPPGSGSSSSSRSDNDDAPAMPRIGSSERNRILDLFRD